MCVCICVCVCVCVCVYITQWLRLWILIIFIHHGLSFIGSRAWDRISFIELYCPTRGNLDGGGSLPTWDRRNCFILLSPNIPTENITGPYISTTSIPGDNLSQNKSFFSVLPLNITRVVEYIAGDQGRLHSIFLFDLFQLIFMTDWRLPVSPKRGRLQQCPCLMFWYVGPAVSLHSCYQIIRVNSSVPDESFTQQHVLISHVL